MNTSDKVQTFIDSFKKKYPREIEDTFYNGQCYWFAHILATRFKGEIWFNPEVIHFATKIDTHLYDIYGIIKDADGWISWSDFQMFYQDAVPDIVNTCIKKIT